ncbi:glycosyltransferase [Halobacteria archaeon AArc-curdl1]|uniref:Glycosyltransferase n=1 Tax=Natronosalvus hydrolyticus TaxID=2979988 RepID=A0AAP2ZBY7_9EURY|nr:glycosyltransferase [Halobacteria archaeon AArc-curdl1]
MATSPDICFVSTEVYGYLNPDQATSGGGAERQQYMIGKELRNRGYSVSYITCSNNDQAFEQINGFEVWGNLPQSNGVLFGPYRLLKLMQIMQKVDAKTYYVRGNRFLTIGVALVCKLLGQPYIYCVASDINVEPEHNNSLWGKYYIKAVDQAGHVTTLTKHQQDILNDEYGISATVVPCGYTIPAESEIVPPNKREYVLWVGRLTKNPKRPDRFLEIAEQLPHINFVMVAAPGDNEDWNKKIRRQAGALENVSFEGFVPPDEIHDYYRKASMLVSTSEYEGFGNVFLEAWRYQTPVISLKYTLDDVISDQKVGIHSGSMSQMIDDIDALHSDTHARHTMGENGRKLVINEFSIDIVANKVQCLIE